MYFLHCFEGLLTALIGVTCGSLSALPLIARTCASLSQSINSNSVSVCAAVPVIIIVDLLTSLSS